MKPKTAATLRLLQDGPKCGQQLIDEGAGYRYSARIGELRGLGYRIVTLPGCTTHRHTASLPVYRLEPEPEQLILEPAR